MSYKLHYFNMRARAELARLVFAYAGVDYDDVRVSYEGDDKIGDWSDIKARAPFGQLPVLEVDGVIMGQSMTIARYLAKKFGLAGATDMEHALADMYVDSVSDLFTAYIPIFYESDAAKKAQMLSDLVNKNIVPHVTRVESQLEKNGGLYLVGKSFTWADLAHLDFLSNYVDQYPEILKNAPLMKSLLERLANVPNVKKWIGTRPKTPF